MSTKAIYLKKTLLSPLFFVFIIFQTLGNQSQGTLPNKNASQKLNNIDSLYILEKQSKITYEEIEQLIYTEINRKNYPRALSYSKMYLYIGNKKNDEKIQYSSNYYLAYLYFLIGSTDDVIYAVNNALKFVGEETPNNKAFRVILLKGSAYMRNSDYENAINTYIEADSYLSNSEVSEERLSLILNIAQCKIRIQRYTDALNDLKFVKKSIDSIPVLNNISEINKIMMPLSTYNAIGICYREIGNLEKSLSILEKNLERAKKLEKEKQMAICYLNIGKTLHRMENYIETEQNLRLARNLFIKNGLQKENFVLTNYYLADCLFRSKNYNESNQYLAENITYLEENKKTEKAVEMTELAIKNAEKKGDNEAVLIYRKLLTDIQKELYQDRNRTKDLLFDKEIVDLKDDNEKLQFSNTRNRAYIRFTIIGVALVSFLLFLYVKKQKTKNKILFKRILEESKKSSQTTQKQENKEVKKLEINDEKADYILKQLEELEKSLFYLNKDCTLHSTAQLLKTNTTYLSKIINEYKNKSFNNYLNDLRISYAIKQLNKDHKYKSYSVKGISEDLGYKSVNTFNNAFKKVTNLSPSYYLKQIKQQELTNN
ncbi:helix-turn-helix domain-containing protein [uncultured Aquimarina sp.]|uniref:helix-turn-helix domain-containing protein n=1 Tax=uncultured Aquimarina sp. TaxID=575652 RepID=UPI002637F87A|nr:helix-turn-helix domain-containing protein [uncultured Aquimarina sp.]